MAEKSEVTRVVKNDVSPDAAVAITLVIPAYNAMPFLKRCLESVKNQTFPLERIDVIAIDDGATDGTGAYLDEYVTELPRFTVIHQENSGAPGGPRNRGIENARGEYIFFLDADDYLGEEAIERMLAHAKEWDSDVLLAKVVGVEGRHFGTAPFWREGGDVDLYTSRIYNTLGPWKLFRRSLLIDNGLRFPEGMKYSEDQYFVAQAYFKAKRISVTADYDYYNWSFRGDNQNLVQVTAADAKLRVGSLKLMLDLVTSNVSLAKNKMMLVRHFDKDLWNAVMALSLTEDEAERSQGFEELRVLVEKHVRKDVWNMLPPGNRALIEFIRRGDLEGLVTFFIDEEIEGTEYPVVIEGKRLFRAYPSFLANRMAFPEGCFEVTKQLAMKKEINHLAWEGRTLHVSGYAYIKGIDLGASTISLVLTSRLTGRRTVAVAEIYDRDDSAETCATGAFDYRSSGFSASLTFPWITIPSDTYGLRIEIDQPGVHLSRKIGRLDLGNSIRVTDGVLDLGTNRSYMTGYIAETGKLRFRRRR